MQVCNSSPILPEAAYLMRVVVKHMRGGELHFVGASSWDEAHWECYLLTEVKHGIKMVSNTC